MSGFHGLLALQVDALLQALRKQQEFRCRQRTSDAEKKATALLQDSRHKLRERVHEAVLEERKRRETALLEARNRLQTAERRKRQLYYDELLQRAWPQLLAELQRRWSDPRCRSEWCEMLLAEAAQVLPTSAWRIEHPTSWSAADSRWLLQRIEARELPPPALQADPGIAAGLKVLCGTACLDGSIRGLLVRTDFVQARLLAAWERELSPPAEASHE